MRLVAVDVGGTAGIALRIGEYLSTMSVTAAEDVWHFIADNEWDVVIYENFATSIHISRYGLYTVRLIGGIQAICMLKATTCIGQQPQYRRAFQDQAKQFLQNERRSSTIHEQDALAHLLAYEYHRNMQESKQNN